MWELQHASMCRTQRPVLVWLERIHEIRPHTWHRLFSWIDTIVQLLLTSCKRSVCWRAQARLCVSVWTWLLNNQHEANTEHNVGPLNQKSEERKTGHDVSHTSVCCSIQEALEHIGRPRSVCQLQHWHWGCASSAPPHSVQLLHTLQRGCTLTFLA